MGQEEFQPSGDSVLPKVNKPAGVDPAAAHPPKSDRKYKVAFYCGTTCQPFDFECASDVSAASIAMFLALQSWPHIHTVTVWKADTMEVVLYAPLNGAVAACSPKLNEMGVKGPIIAALPALPTGTGFRDLMNELKRGQAPPQKGA